MPQISRPGFTINYEITCPGNGPTLILVAGLGEQIGSVEYPVEQCEAFARRGFQVVRIDNRDCGLSLPTGGADATPEQYTRLDIADDVAAVIDDLGVNKVHILGASMGGFIVRFVALRHPEKIASLTVVMSGSAAGQNDPGPGLEPNVIEALAAMAVRHDREKAINDGVENWRWLWGTKYAFDEAWVRERVAYAFDRAYRPEGIGRLLASAGAGGNLWIEQTNITVPTLVVHGEEDPCFSADHGRTIADRIPNAELWLDPSMGHIMHEEQWEELADRVHTLSQKTDMPA